MIDCLLTVVAVMREAVSPRIQLTIPTLALVKYDVSTEGKLLR